MFAFKLFLLNEKKVINMEVPYYHADTLKLKNQPHSLDDAVTS